MYLSSRFKKSPQPHSKYPVEDLTLPVYPQILFLKKADKNFRLDCSPIGALEALAVGEIIMKLIMTKTGK
ncbi:MAG TPA: hypothetical protein VFN95_04935, partial [Flavitalea sp.]|nr:hypothetical protein [Flavitalea sp.]